MKLPPFKRLSLGLDAAEDFAAFDDDDGYCTYGEAGDAGWIHSEADMIQQVGRLVIRSSRV
jgi:hypothetical protein